MSEPEGTSRPASAVVYVLAAAVFVVWFFMFTDSAGDLDQPTPTSPPATDSRPVIVGLPRSPVSLEEAPEER